MMYLLLIQWSMLEFSCFMPAVILSLLLFTETRGQTFTFSFLPLIFYLMYVPDMTAVSRNMNQFSENGACNHS